MKHSKKVYKLISKSFIIIEHGLDNITGVTKASYADKPWLVHSMRSASSAESKTPSTILLKHFSEHYVSLNEGDTCLVECDLCKGIGECPGISMPVCQSCNGIGNITRTIKSLELKQGCSGCDSFYINPETVRCCPDQKIEWRLVAELDKQISSPINEVVSL